MIPASIRALVPSLTLTREERVIVTLVSTAIGAGGAYVLSGNAGTTNRERALSTILGATAALGATHTVLNLLEP